MTNLNKTREEIIYELVLSLNQGDSYYATCDGKAYPRIDFAIEQYKYLADRGIVVEN